MRITFSLASLLLIASLASCSSGLGDFCTSDQDCEPGLRCSATEGNRGVCTYPAPSLLDTGAADASVGDLQLQDAQVETGPEAGPDADSSVQDLQPLIEASPDTQPDTLPDQTLDTLPDQAVDTFPDQTVD